MKVFNHGIHIILDILTCGMWLPVHLLLYLLAPTVPIGMGASAAASSTVVVHPPMPYASTPYPPTGQHPPTWAIDEVRASLPPDAPWSAIEAMAWQAVQRGPQRAMPPGAVPPPPSAIPAPPPSGSEEWPPYPDQLR